MKNIFIILLSLLGSFVYSQNGSMTIVNFSSQNISFMLLGSNIGNAQNGCLPTIGNESYNTLTSGSMLTYDTYNTSHLQNPPTVEWLVHTVSGSGQMYNVSMGNLIPQNIVDMTKWSSVDILTLDGNHLSLGRSCAIPSTFTDLATASGITAQWYYSGDDVTIVIT